MRFQGRAESGEPLVGYSLPCCFPSLLHTVQILCIDEATASVDQKTEQLLQQTICKRFANKTVLTIAHRCENSQGQQRPRPLTLVWIPRGRSDSQRQLWLGRGSRSSVKHHLERHYGSSHSTDPGTQTCGGQACAVWRDLEGDAVTPTDGLLPHRLNTILNSDRVLVLQAGRVVELDSPSVLRDQPHSLFQQLLQSGQQGAHSLPAGC